jgi:hypothetical protein
MSAAQRKAVGERMKKYWAARRAAEQGTATDGASTGAAEVTNAAATKSTGKRRQKQGRKK